MKRYTELRDFTVEHIIGGFRNPDGKCRVTYTSPATNRKWVAYVPLYDVEDILEVDNPKRCRLNRMKAYVKAHDLNTVWL